MRDTVRRTPGWRSPIELPRSRRDFNRLPIGARGQVLMGERTVRIHFLFPVNVNSLDAGWPPGSSKKCRLVVSAIGLICVNALASSSTKIKLGSDVIFTHPRSASTRAIVPAYE